MGPINVFQQDGILVVTCHLLIAFTNSLDPDQNVGPDLDVNGLTLLFLKALNLKNKNQQTTRKPAKLPSMQS